MEKVNTAGELLFAFPERATAAEESTETLLVHLAQSGDKEAFGKLYQRFGSMVHGILLARVPFVEVDDLVQEVFLVAFRQIKSLRDARTFGGWLATITRNCAADFHRRTRNTEELTEQVAARNSVSVEALEALRLLQTLPEAYRESLALRLVEGMSGAEIAERTGLTPASVRVNLHRGMRQLRELLQAKGEMR
jgi:RNA polymerase sigma-70 factor (ECF subfamily)